MRTVILLLTLSIAVFAESYTVKKIEPPKDVELSLGGLCLDHSGDVLVSTRAGDVWNLKEGKWRQLASGLQEPMALVQSWREGEYFALQRAELTKMVDEDNNGSFDLFESFAKGWQFTGSKNDFAVALTTDVDGNFYTGISLSLTDDGYANAQVKNRGVIYKVDYVGEKTVFATGAYKPVGATFNENGDLFISENQGGYVAANCIYHVEEGDFLGNPLSLSVDSSKNKLLTSIMRKRGEDRVKEFNKLRKKPALYLPDNFSSSGISFDTTEGKFGPYVGQLFIADFDNGLISRASLEKVKDVYQGAVMTFIESEDLSALRLQFGKEGELYVGKGGDGCCAGNGLYEIAWNQKVTFDIHSIRLLKNGFKLVFTSTVNKEKISGSIKVKSFSYEYTAKIDATKLEEKEHAVSAIKVSEDGLEVDVSIDSLLAGKVYQIDYSGIIGAGGEKLKYSQAYYTLNELID